MRYISWLVALLESCDVTKHGRHLGCHLEFYQELEVKQAPNISGFIAQLVRASHRYREVAVKSVEVLNNFRLLTQLHKLRSKLRGSFFIWFNLIRNQVKTAIFFVLNMKNNTWILSTLHHFIPSFTFIADSISKTCTFTQKWLDHLLLMTSYLATIVTDHH